MFQFRNLYNMQLKNSAKFSKMHKKGQTKYLRPTTSVNGQIFSIWPQKDQVPNNPGSVSASQSY